MSPFPPSHYVPSQTFWSNKYSRSVLFPRKLPIRPPVFAWHEHAADKHNTFTNPVGVGNILTGKKLWTGVTANRIEDHSPTVGDVDGDGRPEVFVGDDWGYVYCFRGADGALKWRFLAEWIRCTPTLYDVDGDGKLEIIFGGDFDVYCIEPNGTLKWSYYTGDSFEWDHPCVDDVDGDGEPEVVIGCWNGRVYCLRAIDGAVKWIYDSAGDLFLSKPAIKDIDGDGIKEVIIGGDSYTHCLKPDGTLKWRADRPKVNIGCACVGDIDGDGVDDILIGDWSDNYFYCLKPDGTVKWRYLTGSGIFCSAGLADIDKDGMIEVLFASLDHYLYCLKPDGTLKWRYYTEGTVCSGIALCDVDNDGRLEAVFADAWRVYCVKADGTLLWSYPMEVGAEYNPAAIDDVNKDGKVEIAIGDEAGKLHVFTSD